MTFSAASMFLLLPLLGFALTLGGLGFGLSAGAFLLPGLFFSAFNLVSFCPASGFPCTTVPQVLLCDPPLRMVPPAG